MGKFTKPGGEILNQSTVLKESFEEMTRELLALKLDAAELNREIKEDYEQRN